MIISKDECRFELHIINNEKCSDYCLGRNLSCPLSPDRYDPFEEEVPIILDELANELMPTVNGEEVFHILVNFTYERIDCGSDGYDYDFDYTYKVLHREPGQYFAKLLREQSKEPDTGAYVKMYRGDYEYLEPLEDYLDREAYKYGYDNYDNMKENGLSIDIPVLYNSEGVPFENDEILRN